MLFGLQAPALLQADQIAQAQARLQKRMEDDPSVPSMQPGGQAVLPAPAFVNGPAGTRMSPDELAFRRRQNAEQMATGMDFSPVQSWTQGAARIANLLVASGERRKLDQAAASNERSRATILRELSRGTPSAEAVTAAVADPDPAVQSLGEKAWALQHPKPQGPSDLQQRVEYLNTFESGLGATYAKNYAANGGGAPQFVNTSQGTFMVPRTPTAPTASGGIPDAAVAYLRSNPASAAQFDAKYGTGASNRYLQGGAAPQAPSPFVTR